ncbi:hypothetical protein MHEC_00980 [Mycobacterium heckeshornense]|uniref:Uncharacterized protein n=1 Tax=Mycobacterium heckeshornense TaxID=110505 RepID=A0A7R7JFC6_9MYCO|nr:hypothetical protein MHEC_00980 [Mycobacterium heckeshornense]
MRGDMHVRFGGRAAETHRVERPAGRCGPTPTHQPAHAPTRTETTHRIRGRLPCTPQRSADRRKVNRCAQNPGRFITQSLDLTGPGIPPATQHPVPACRTRDLPSRQPGLDADNISLYRHHRCLRALQRGTPQADQDFSGVPRTHQFLVTLTVHTNKINPAATPTVTSADSMKNGHPVVAIQRDGQQPDRGNACWGSHTGLTTLEWKSHRILLSRQSLLDGSARQAGRRPGRRRARRSSRQAQL